jgi:ribonuclease G
MSKELCISSTPHETRLAIVEDDQLTEIYYERENEYTLAGSIYKGRVTRVLPGMQSAFVDIGLERDAFLYVTDFLEEAGEAADFEKPQSSGGGAGRGRREPRAPREASEVRTDTRSDNRPDTRIQLDPVSDEPQSASPRAAAPASTPDEEFDQGTRKWRGRRGRRRGFRGGQREGSAPAAPAASASELEGVSENYHDEPEAPFEAVAGLPISASAQAPASPRPSFSSTREHSRQVHHESSAKPTFLPGESLSKYGHQPAAPVAQATSTSAPIAKPGAVITSRPSTIVEGPLGWDGVSAALPGESLSRHKNRPNSIAVNPVAEPIEAAVETSHAETAHAQAISSEPAIAENVAEEPTPLGSHFEDRTAASTSPSDEQHHDASASHAAPIEILHAVHNADGVTFEQVHQQSEPPAIPAPETVEGFTAQHPATLELEEVEEAVELGQPAAHAEPHDFEPESASASYRVTPAPSEFRLATPVEDEPVTHQGVREMQEFFTETPIGLSETMQFLSEETAEPTHSLQAEAAPETEPFNIDAAHASAEAAQAEPLHAFAPGHGVLEEEVIDEEEYDFTPLHGHADDHDLEEIEEETTDNTMVGSQLGDLVRDEHIQRRVMGDGDQEDDDFEELESDSDSDEDDDLEESASEADDAHARAEAGGEAFTEEDFLGEPHVHASEANGAEASVVPAPRRDDSRRGGRNNERGGRRGNGQRGRSGGHRNNAQTSDLPIISDLLKQGQEVLIQIAKEPIAKKGARITSHIALPGRFLVFMPTVNHVGVSRKISSDEERLRLKRVLTSEKGTAPGGFIVRTAADGASEEELRADLRFLISLWTEIKHRSDTGKSPALIYHDLNLVERVLRDQVSDNFTTIWVDSEVEYERIVRFLNRFEPSLVRRVKLYTKETPLFEQFGIQEEISKALKSKVWLKSGGSIVINQTEALVAIDINTGKYVGKTARLEDTIVKTNLDAIPEIVRQIRLRDLGGIIIIDFIDMDERKNRHRVMQALEEALKADRAPSKVLQFNDFGLVAITRKRVKQSLERTLSTQCEICAGTGMVKSPITVCNEIYTELRKMQKHFERADVLLRVHPEIVKALKANNGKWLSELEEMIGRTIIVKSDPALHPEQFDIH